MKIATMATGGIGGYLAVKLAKAGHDVACIARGPHLEAIRENGLKLEGYDGDHVVTPWIATDNPADVGPVDAIIFGVKGDATRTAGEACKPMLGDDTIVVPFLNGVEASDVLTEVLPEKNVGNGIAMVSTTISAPGVITQKGEFNQFIFAERDSRPSARVTALQEAINEAGSSAPATDDVVRDLWFKFILFSAGSGITAAARCTIGDILGNAHLTTLYKSAFREAIAVARARNVNVPETIEDDVWKTAQSFPPTMRASTAIDLEKGLPLEIDWITGAVVRLSDQLGIDAPISRTLYALLSPYKNGRP